MENTIRFLFVCIFLFNLSLVKTDISIMKIDFENKELWRKYNENKFLRIDIKTEDLPNYIKLIAKDLSKENIYSLNLIISYYQDISFTNRKKLSQNSSDTTIMWLNKEQIKNGFYLNLECGASTCNYNFSIIPENSMELHLGEIYKYYITEENKEMKFNILGDINKTDEKKLVTIYAKGYRDIYSKLEEENNIKHSKYNAYIIDDIKSTNVNYNFIVNGNVGDLVTVGAFFCEKTGICTINEFNAGYEYSGFLKKNVLEENCFLYSHFYRYSYQFIFNDIYSQAFSKDIYKTSSDNKSYKCIKIFDEVDEIFYSFYIYNINDKYIPLISGNYNFFSSSNFSFIPLIAEDFTLLTYKIYTFQKETKMYIIKCKTYPLCNLDLELDKINNIKEFENFFYNYFITFSKNELESNWSPINKNQHVILFICEPSGSENGGTKIEIFTDKTVLDIDTGISNYYFIEKGKTNNFFSSSNKPEIISIETISGSISIKIIGLNNDKNYKIYNYYNIYSYEYDKDEKYKMIQIKANKNSIYNIKTQIFYYDYYDFKFGGSYILRLNNNIKISLRSSGHFIHEDILKNYLSINSIGYYNSVDREYHKYGQITIYSGILKNGFYQDIFMKPTYDVNEYIVFDRSDEKDSMVLLSYFLLSEKRYDIIDSGIILAENIPRLFSFNKVNKEIIYYFYHTDINRNINLEIKLLNEGNYQMILYINNEDIEKKYNISSNETILLEENNWKNKCKEPLHICIFKFNIIYYNESDSLLEMKIKVENNFIDNDVKNNNNQIEIILFIILIIIGFIIIVAIIFFILRIKKRTNVINNMNELDGDTELLNKGKD